MKKISKLKVKLNNYFVGFYQEVARVGVIGRKLLTASRTNAHLKDTYEELGRLCEVEIESGNLDMSSAKMRGLLHIIKACKQDLEHLERQVYKVKFSSTSHTSQNINAEISDEKNKNN